MAQPQNRNRRTSTNRVRVDSTDSAASSARYRSPSAYGEAYSSGYEDTRRPYDTSENVRGSYDSTYRDAYGDAYRDTYSSAGLYVEQYDPASYQYNTPRARVERSQREARSASESGRIPVQQPQQGAERPRRTRVSARDSYESSERGEVAERPARTARQASARGTAGSRGNAGGRNARYSRDSYGSRSGSGSSADARGTRTRSSRGGAARGASGGRNIGGAGAGSIAGTLSSLPIAKIGIAIALLVIVVFLVRTCMSMMPITVTINGIEREIHGAKTVQSAAQESGIPLNPGDLISLHGNVLKRTEGEVFSAEVNGEKVTDFSMRLSEGDVLQLGDGDDIVEAYDATQQPVPHDGQTLGVGSLHIYTDRGADGILETRVGQISGEVVEKQTLDPVLTTISRVNPITSEKIIALTFDDGPSTYTPEVLDLLKQYDAKATFFVVGTNLEQENLQEFTRRASDEGHQIASHTYSHALNGNSVNIGSLSPDEQIYEIQHNFELIEQITGQSCNGIVRLPGGSFDDDVVIRMAPYFDIEIGWNVDSYDWTMPGAEAIANEILAADPGEIILCHDGGGDRSQTVEALKIALPQLIKQGYRLVTLDELLAACENEELDEWKVTYGYAEPVDASASGSASSASAGA